MTSPVGRLSEGAFRGDGLEVRSPRWVTAAAERASARTRPDEYLMYASMGLLLISTIQETGRIGDAVKLVWLVSVALLTVFNVGAAFGVYVAAAALFAVLSFDGWGSPIERPDNYALLLVAGGLAYRIVARRPARLWDRSMLVIGGFVAYALLQTAWLGLFNRSTIAGYMRMFGLPMLMFLLLARHGVSLRELRALVRSLLVLAAYMALVSIAERVGGSGLIVPAWIADPSITVVIPARAEWVRTGRSGGPLMQAEYNGLALSLIYCVAIFSSRFLEGRRRWAEAVVGLLCLVGVFFTYTRAAWVACVVASVILLWRPWGSRPVTRLKRFAVVTASAAVIVALALLPETFARQRIDDSGTVVTRLNLWKVALSMAADRPLLGSGFGTFPVRLQDYRQEMTVGAPPTIGETVAHNIFLSVLVEHGTIGLLLYASVLVAVFRGVKTAAVRVWGHEGGVWVMVLAGVYLFQMQFMVLGDPAPNQIFFGMMGALAAIRVHGLPSGIPGAASSSIRVSRRRDSEGRSSVSLR